MDEQINILLDSRFDLMIRQLSENLKKYYGIEEIKICHNSEPFGTKELPIYFKYRKFNSTEWLTTYLTINCPRLKHEYTCKNCGTVGWREVEIHDFKELRCDKCKEKILDFDNNTIILD
jgi:DNA-directed RNA polymerase subunit RPC12/RpoP